MRPGQDALMPRQMRIEYAGAMYHLVSRGARREPEERGLQTSRLEEGQ
jgi:hypothetical protein